MYAIVKSGGKQYKVSKGTRVEVEKLDAKVGDKVELDVLMIENEGSLLLDLDLTKAKVTATVIEQGKDKKIIVYKYKAKKNIRKKQGHRQPYTALVIDEIAVK